jgi:hypothetical protein
MMMMMEVGLDGTATVVMARRCDFHLGRIGCGWWRMALEFMMTISSTVEAL